NSARRPPLITPLPSRPIRALWTPPPSPTQRPSATVAQFNFPNVRPLPASQQKLRGRRSLSHALTDWRGTAIAIRVLRRNDERVRTQRLLCSANSGVDPVFDEPVHRKQTRRPRGGSGQRVPYRQAARRY